jgi:hypothetical protein
MTAFDAASRAFFNAAADAEHGEIVEVESVEEMVADLKRIAETTPSATLRAAALDLIEATKPLTRWSTPCTRPLFNVGRSTK